MIYKSTWRLFLILSWLVNSLAWSYQVEVEMPGCPIFDAWGWSAASWISNSHGEERMGGTRISREEAINHLRLWCSQNGDVCEPESNWIIINLGLRKDNADDSEDSIEE